MHSGDLSELEKSDLSEQEKETLLQVMQRAKSEDKRKQPPRGSLHLWGAVIAPSDEDSQSFSISGTNSEVYKLRAIDAKQRQYWVSRLRREVENCTNQFSSLAITPTSSPATTPSKGHPNGSIGDHPLTATASSPTTHSRNISKRLHAISFSKLKHVKSEGGNGKGGAWGAATGGGGVGSVTSVRSETDSASPRHSLDLEREEFPGGDAMLEVLTRLQSYQESMQMQLESYGHQTGLDPFSKNALLLKATSQAAVHSVRDCLALMKLQQQREQTALSEQKHPQKGATGLDTSPSRPRSMAGLDVQVNAAAMDAPGDNWRERSSSDGKILKKTAS